MAIKIKLPNDGIMVWKATQNDYFDGQGNQLHALGTLLMFDFSQVWAGWIKYEKGCQTVTHFVLVPDDGGDEAWWQAINAAKPSTGKIDNAYRITVRNGALGSRALTATTGSMIRAVNGLNLAYDTASERLDGSLPVVRLTSVQAMAGDKPFLTPDGAEVWTPVLTIEGWKKTAVAPSQGSPAAPSQGSPAAPSQGSPAPSAPISVSVLRQADEKSEAMLKMDRIRERNRAMGV